MSELYKISLFDEKEENKIDFHLNEEELKEFLNGIIFSLLGDCLIIKIER